MLKLARVGDTGLCLLLLGVLSTVTGGDMLLEDTVVLPPGELMVVLSAILGDVLEGVELMVSALSSFMMEV